MGLKSIIDNLLDFDPRVYALETNENQTAYILAFHARDFADDLSYYKKLPFQAKNSGINYRWYPFKEAKELDVSPSWKLNLAAANRNLGESYEVIEVVDKK